MWSTREVGSLAVVENTIDRRRIDHELRGMDRNLFLDAEIDQRQRFVWTVKEHIGSESPPHLVLEWRDRDGTPLPLTSGILDAVRQADGRGRNLVREVSDHNDRLRAERDKRAEEAHEEIMRDMLPRMNPVRSAVLPRGVSLRMSRDRQRSRGWNV